MIKRWHAIIILSGFIFLLIILLSYIGNNDEKPKLVNHSENKILPPPIKEEEQTWSFLSKKYQDTRVESYCKVRQEKWRNKLVKINNYDIHFNLLGSDDIVSESIYRHGSWEISIVQTILLVLKKTSEKRGGIDISFLDIGANIGWFTTIIAKHGYNTIAFEPLHVNIEIMSSNICNNNIESKVTVFNTGLGLKEDTCWVISGHINIGDGIIKCGTKPDNSYKEPGSGHIYYLRQEISINLLDHYLDNININPPIGVMKIDVEGYEENVFRGGLNFLKNYPPWYILIEIIYSYNTEFIHLLYEYGYYIATPTCENPVMDEKQVPNHMNLYLKSSPDICFIHKNAM